MNLLTKQKETHRLRKQTYGCWGEKIGSLESLNIYTAIYSEWITNKNLLYSTWNSTQCYVPAWIAGWVGKECIYVYVRLSPFTIHLKPPRHC